MNLNRKVLLLISTMLTSVVIVNCAAHAGNITITGDDTWNGDQSYTGTGGVNEGISMDSSGVTATITANGNIEANNNTWRGLHAASGNLIINNTASGKTLTFTDNGERGLEAGRYDTSNASVTIKNMNVIASNNGAVAGFGAGIMAGNGSTITLIGDSSGQNSVIANNNVNNSNNGVGIIAEGIKDGFIATVNIENMNVVANENGRVGISSTGGGVVNITGNGSNILRANGHNSSSDLYGGAGIYSNDFGSSINISDMDAIIQDNAGVGLFSEGGAKISMSSSSGNNTLNISNSGRAIATNGVNGGVSSSVDIDNMNVILSGNHHGILVTSGGKVNFTNSTSGNSLQILNSTEEGVLVLDVNGVASTLTVEDMNVSVNNSAKVGMKAENGGKINISSSSKANTFGLYDNDKYGLLVTGVNSEMNINGMIVSGRTNDHALMGIERGGTYNFTDSSVSTENGSLFHIWSDEGSLNKVVFNNSRATSAGTNLFTIDADNVVIEANGSYLENSIYTQTGKTSNVSMTGSEWVMKEQSNITNFTAVGSKIDLRKTNGHNTLTLSSLTSNSTDYFINTYFNVAGDQSDKIIVDGGAATGAENILYVSSTGYDGSYVTNGYGIQIVNLDNAIDKSIVFSLFGDTVNSGAYDYILYKADDDNYYLQGTKNITSIFKTIANMPATHLSIVKTGMNELRKRMGELRDNSAKNKDGLWVRSYAKSLKVDDTVNSKMNLYGMEMGYDKQVYSTCDNKAYVGVMAGYLYTDNIKYRNGSPYNNNAHANTQVWVCMLLG